MSGFGRKRTGSYGAWLGEKQIYASLQAAAAMVVRTYAKRGGRPYLAGCLLGAIRIRC